MIWIFIAIVVVGLIVLIVYNAKASKPRPKVNEEAETDEAEDDMLPADPEHNAALAVSPAPSPEEVRYEDIRTERHTEEPVRTAGTHQPYEPPPKVKTPASVKLARDNDFRSSLRHLSHQENEDLHDKMKSDDAYRDALRAMNRASREEGE